MEQQFPMIETLTQRFGQWRVPSDDMTHGATSLTEVYSAVIRQRVTVEIVHLYWDATDTEAWHEAWHVDVGVTDDWVYDFRAPFQGERTVSFLLRERSDATALLELVATTIELGL